ncbi:MAG: GTP-binding protein [Alphaproteobacteria bacterium]|nr:GTP-binding protein [Alphaproteobacteria bacterium]
MGQADMDASGPVTKKICLIGQFGVGKTSLVRRYVLGQFSPKYQATVGVNVYKHSDRVARQGTEVSVNQIIWDVDGALQNVAVLGNYLRGSAGAIVVGDISVDASLAAMETHLARFRAQLPGRPVVVALNKIDLVDPSTAEAAAERTRAGLGLVTVLTSAADGTAVPELFRTLASLILEHGT